MLLSNLNLEFAAQIVVAVVTGVLSALLGLHLALKKHRSGKIWDSKHAAYTKIVECLADIRSYASEAYSRTAPALPAVSENRLIELRKSFEEARIQLRRHAQSGALTISGEAQQLLTQLLNELEQERFRNEEDGPIDEYDFKQEAKHYIQLGKIVNKYQDRLLAAAKRDLNT